MIYMIVLTDAQEQVHSALTDPTVYQTKPYVAVSPIEGQPQLAVEALAHKMARGQDERTNNGTDLPAAIVDS